MPPDHIAFAILPSYEALLASEHGDHRAAVAKADRAIALGEANSQGLDYLPQFLLRRAEVSLRAGRLDDARADAERALAMEKEATAPGEFSSGIGRDYLMLSRALLGQGKIDESRIAAKSALEHLQSSLGTDHPMTRDARKLAGTESSSR